MSSGESWTQSSDPDNEVAVGGCFSFVVALLISSVYALIPAYVLFVLYQAVAPDSLKFVSLVGDCSAVPPSEPSAAVSGWTNATDACAQVPREGWGAILYPNVGYFISWCICCAAFVVLYYFTRAPRTDK